MASPPTGAVTFLFADVVGSTRLWEAGPEAMDPAMARHDALIEGVVEAHDGLVVRPRGEGDSRFAVFARAAAAAAIVIGQVLTEEPWPTSSPLAVPMALHTGEADVRDGDYYGSAVNRCARLRSVARPGQVLCSLATAELVRDRLPPGVELVDVGPHRLKHIALPEYDSKC